jgi:hypothetical protein
MADVRLFLSLCTLAAMMGCKSPETRGASVVPDPPPADASPIAPDHASGRIGYTPVMQGRRAIVTRTLRHGERDDGAFDLDFWRRLGHEAIFEAAWEMVAEARAFRGEDGDEPRLQRSLLRVVRRGG